MGTGTIRLSPKLSQKQAPLSTNLAFFSNGWQSWSFTGVYRPFEQYRHTRLGAFVKPTIINAGVTEPRQEGLFFSDMFGVLGNRANRMAVLAGFPSQRQHFGVLEAYLHPVKPALRLWANGDGARLDPGAKMATDWACLCILHIDSPDSIGPYLEAVAREHSLSSDGVADQPSPTGWCSWYRFSKEDYTGNVSAEDIRQNSQAIARLKPDLPLELVQIDDGFEAQVGDWFASAPSFPDGVAPLAEEVRLLGLKPGLWLAPFSVHPKSRLFSEHPDWLLRGRLNRLDVDAMAAEEGRNWYLPVAQLVFSPSANRVLVAFSDGGSDAVALREYDLTTGSFVADGFERPVRRHIAVWEDEDTLLVATPLSEEEQTASAYPRHVRRWSRGTALESAPIVYSVEREHVIATPLLFESASARQVLMAGVTSFTEVHTFAFNDAVSGSAHPITDPGYDFLGEMMNIVDISKVTPPLSGGFSRSWWKSRPLMKQF